jgi:hypothetical protein
VAVLVQVLTAYRVVFEDGFVQAQSYRVAYAVFGTLAVTSSLVSIVYRIHHARHLRSDMYWRRIGCSLQRMSAFHPATEFRTQCSVVFRWSRASCPSLSQFIMRKNCGRALKTSPDYQPQAAATLL